MLYRIVPAAFQYVRKAGEVAVDVGVGILQGIAHTGLGGKIHYNFRLFLIKKFRNSPSICKIGQGESEREVSFQNGQTVLFELDVIVVVKIINPDNLMSIPQKPLRKMKADESGCASDQYAHERCLFLISCQANRSFDIFC
jgi:hypothetical protein